MVGLKPLGNTGENIPEIGIGTWHMGIGPIEGVKAIKTAIDNGMWFIDTAEMYATEHIVGTAINGRKVFLATKVSPNHFRHDGVLAACDNSLKNLNVKQIDLYQLHWPNRSIQIKETMAAMEELVDSGRIRYIGVSNFTIEELVEAQNAMTKHQIVSNQVEYSILTRNIENGLLDFCTDNNITIIAYSPFGNGALYSSRYRKTYDMLKHIGGRHSKTATQVALNWLISKRNVVAIPKSASKEHVLENGGSSGWKLTKSELNEINAINERKGPLGGFIYPILKRTGIWANAMQSFNEKRNKPYKKDSNTTSSKK